MKIAGRFSRNAECSCSKGNKNSFLYYRFHGVCVKHPPLNSSFARRRELMKFDSVTLDSPVLMSGILSQIPRMKVVPSSPRGPGQPCSPACHLGCFWVSGRSLLECHAFYTYVSFPPTASAGPSTAPRSCTSCSFLHLFSLPWPWPASLSQARAAPLQALRLGFEFYSISSHVPCSSHYVKHLRWHCHSENLRVPEEESLLRFLWPHRKSARAADFRKRRL